MEPFIDHIEITVKNMDVAVPFYDELLPLLGFDIRNKNRAWLEEHELDVVEYEHPNIGFAINSPRSALAEETIHRRRPGSLHHLAFRAQSRAEVDGLYPKLQRIGATIVSPPKEYPDYVPKGYYAMFFKDPEGIKYEVVCTKLDPP